MSRFDNVMIIVLKWEGGYVDHPDDPGGATNMGITHKVLAKYRGVATVTPREVKDLTKAEALDIFREFYWEPLRAADLPEPVDLVVMDGGVNHGITNMAKMLQTVVGASTDGAIGPKTIEAVADYIAKNDVIELTAAVAGKRRERYVTRPHAATFLRGWRNRLEDVMKAALVGTGFAWGFDTGLARADRGEDDGVDLLSMPASINIFPVIEDVDLQIYMQAKGTYTDAIDGLFGRNSLAGMNAVLEHHRVDLSGVLSQWDVPRRKLRLVRSCAARPASTWDGSMASSVR